MSAKCATECATARILCNRIFRSLRLDSGAINSQAHCSMRTSSSRLQSEQNSSRADQGIFAFEEEGQGKIPVLRFSCRCQRFHSTRLECSRQVSPGSASYAGRRISSAILCLTFTHSGTAADRLFGKVDHTMQTPSIRTIMVTHTNGSSRYIPDDAAFEQISYEITTSHLKSGCTENAIVNGFLHLIEQR